LTVQTPSDTDYVEGTQSGAAITTAAGVTIQGFGTGQAITTGSNNTIFGYNSSNSLTTGAGNTVVGANVSGPAAAAANVVILADGTGQARFDYGQTTAAVATVTAPLAVNPVATSAGTSATPAVTFSTTANLGIFWGSGAPSFTAAQGALYIRTDGSSTSTRVYVNTTGSTTWTNVTTAA